MNSIPVLESERILRFVPWRQVFDMDEQIPAQIARLEAGVQHIQVDISDIKADLRRTNDKIDAARVELTQKIEGVREGLTQKIDAVSKDLTQKIDGVRTELTGNVEGVRADLTENINGLRKDIDSMKAWAIGLYIALASSLLLVMAKGFKWM